MKKIILNHLNFVLGAAIVGLMGCATTGRVKNGREPIQEKYGVPAVEQQPVDSRPIMVKYGVPPSLLKQQAPATTDTNSSSETQESTSKQ